MTTLTALTQVATSENINKFAEIMTNQIRNGEVDVLEAYAQIKILETAFDKVKKDTSDIVQDEVSKLNKNEKYFGFEWSVIEAGIKYDYSNCNHSEWIMLNEQIEQLNKRKKEIEDVLKSAGKVAVVDLSTGELCNPPVRKCTTTIKMIKK